LLARERAQVISKTAVMMAEASKQALINSLDDNRMLGLLSTNQGGDNPYPRRDPNEASSSGGKGRNQQEVGREPKIGEEGNPLTAIAKTKKRIKVGKGAGVKRVPQKASRKATPTNDNKDDDEDDMHYAEKAGRCDIS
jgi:hypothetical protein